MVTRMLCTDCSRMAVPDTLLAGSDRLERVGWCLLGIPGWLYCAWRHWLRVKLCPDCGSDRLMREARALQGLPVAGSSRTRSACGGALWPPPFDQARVRLRLGGLALLVGIAVLPLAGLAGPAFTLVFAAWAWHVLARALRDRTPNCAAWDASGRRLRIDPA